MLITLGLIAAIFSMIVGALAFGYYPKEVQEEEVVILGEAPLISKKKSFKVLTYNVQFMAGKDYVFWFDVPEGDGPDSMPLMSSIRRTIKDVVKVIVDEDPDFVLLQEIDDGAKRTGNQDQLQALLEQLPKAYKYHTSAFYWKSGFVPHQRILGRAGMKLSTLSKHPIISAKRHKLPLKPDNFIAKHLGIKRAVLEANVPYAEGGKLVLLNTHLEAFSKQSDISQKQVDHISVLLKSFNEKNIPWVIGGDFNLLHQGQLVALEPRQRIYYQPESELSSLTNQFACIPSITDIQSDPSKWYSFYSNDPDVKAPDRTLDYIFYSPLFSCESKSVRQHDTANISDHFPVIASFKQAEYSK